MAGKLSPRLVTAVFITLIFGISLCIRTLLPYDAIFGGEWIKYSGIDAYYHMRFIDSIAHNFPGIIDFNPYFIYPGGHGVGDVLFFDWFPALIIWLVSLGSPTQHTIDVISVFCPAVLGALVVIPVYFIGKALFNRWVGVLSAALIAILPGEFLGRSILGFTDQHIAESLLTAVALLFLILALKTAAERRLTLEHLRERDRSVIARPLLYSVLAGVFMGLYMLTWQGSLLFVFLITLYLIVQFIIDHFRGKPAGYLCIIGFVLFLVAGLVRLPVAPSNLYIASIVVAMIIPVALYGVSAFMDRRGLRPVYYPLALIGLAAAGLGVFYALQPALLTSMLSKFTIFAPTGATAVTTLEARPIFFPGDEFTWKIAWGNFTTGLFVSLIGLGLLIFLAVKWNREGRDTRGVILLLVWSLLMLVVTLSQRRFAYYYAVNVSLLSGYIAWQAIWFAGLRKFKAEQREISQREPGGNRPRHVPGARRPPAIYFVNTILAVIVVFVAVYYFNIPHAISVARNARFAPSDAWVSSLTWMKENTPEPFPDPEYYYQDYEIREGESYEYPETAYGVTSWWDYGYLITRIARRLPNANPSQGVEPTTRVANFFLSQGDSPPQELLEKLDSSYVVIDYTMATNKFWAMVTWSEQEMTEFFDFFYLRHEGRLLDLIVYYPAYYRTLNTRLYNFDNREVTTGSPLVISYEEKTTGTGQPYKEIVNAQDFDSYDEAQKYIESQQTGNHVIVGANPFVSPIPLEPVKSYKLVHSSEEAVSHQQVGQISEVKIFEYTGK